MRSLTRFAKLVILPAAATLAVLVLLLIGLEFVLRWRDPDYFSKIASDDIDLIHTYSETYGWRLERIRIPGELTVNRKGYRGKEYDYEKPSGVTRIVVLGDSIAFGYKAKDDEVFSDQLDRMREDVEVINLAVQGYGTDQSLIKLENEGLRYHPDVVVLVTAVKYDALENGRAEWNKESPKPYFLFRNGELVKVDAHLKLSLYRRMGLILSQKSVLYNELLALLHVDRTKYRQELVPDDVGEKPEYILTFRLMKRMHDLLAERGIRFIVLMMPDKGSFRHDHTDMVTTVCSTSSVLQGVTMLDMYDEYTRRGFVYSNFYDYAVDRFCHLGADGHRMTAEILEQALVERGWLKPRPSKGPDGG